MPPCKYKDKSEEISKLLEAFILNEYGALVPMNYKAFRKSVQSDMTANETQGEITPGLKSYQSGSQIQETKSPKGSTSDHQTSELLSKCSNCSKMALQLKQKDSKLDELALVNQDMKGKIEKLEAELKIFKQAHERCKQNQNIIDNEIRKLTKNE